MIDSLQIALFVARQPASAIALFALGFPDAELESFQKQPNGGSVGTVHYDQFDVMIQTQLTRVDIVISAHQDEEAEPSSFGFEDFDPAFDVANVMCKAFASELTINRLALILNSSVAVDSETEAMADIMRRVPGLPMPAGAQDLDFRVNVPVRNASGKIVFNRLLRWFGARRQLVALSLPQATSSAGDMRHVSVLSIDINTPVGLSVDDDPVALLSEMAAAARTALTEGYEALR